MAHPFIIMAGEYKVARPWISSPPPPGTFSSPWGRTTFDFLPRIPPIS